MLLCRLIFRLDMLPLGDSTEPRVDVDRRLNETALFKARLRVPSIMPLMVRCSPEVGPGGLDLMRLRIYWQTSRPESGNTVEVRILGSHHASLNERAERSPYLNVALESSQPRSSDSSLHHMWYHHA
jgi:hypothetical protein